MKITYEYKRYGKRYKSEIQNIDPATDYRNLVIKI